LHPQDIHFAFNGSFKAHLSLVFFAMVNKTPCLTIIDYCCFKFTQTVMQPIQGFSKLGREQKILALQQQNSLFDDLRKTLDNYLHPTEQQLFNDISENTLSNYYLPFGLAPNFLVDGKLYHVPMVIEESSVVAAAAKGARFWASRGGFRTRIQSTLKTGQIHFEWHGPEEPLQRHLAMVGQLLRQAATPITQNMEKRGGGIVGMTLLPTGNTDRHLWQLLVTFETVDSMGANFINSCLEAMRQPLEDVLNTNPLQMAQPAQVIMCILSNYTPQCVVQCTVECPIDELAEVSGTFSPHEFAQRFEKAVYIANNDPFRAATHNKGIFNGIDAVALATGNDFRAIEANGHAHAAVSGRYSGLTHVSLSPTTFTYTLEVPLAVGTVGGLTALHPLAKTAMQLLGAPNAETLMAVMAATGLSNNFMAVSALVTGGIQKGHMKMHLTNILRTLGTSEAQMEAAKAYFIDKTVSYSAVAEFLNQQKSHQ
jgi:hydroxymethylglutaryl-CoA reductase